MKNIFAIIAILFFAASAKAQTRNVVVNTNSVIISPTNFWSADAVNARSGLGLGTAATLPSTAFQFASANLTALASNNGINLTNISISNTSGTLSIANGGTGATNAATARTNLGVGWSALTNTTSSGFQADLFGVNTNPVLVNASGSVVSPTNFWQAAPIATTLQNSTPITNSTNAATNARLLFLFSLAPSTVGVTNTITLPTNGNTFNGDVATITHNGPTSSVTAIRELGDSTNIITLNQQEETVRLLYRNNQWTLMDNISQIEPIYFSGTNASANAAASRINLGLGEWSTLNDGANIRVNALTVSDGEQLDYIQFNSGTGVEFFGNRASQFRSALVLGATWLTNTNVTNFRTAIGLGATNNVTFSNIIASGTLTSTGVVTAVSNVVIAGTLTSTGAVTAITNLNVGGAIAVTNTALTRTNLGLPLPALTNTTAANFRTAIELGSTNNVAFSNVVASGTLTSTGVVTAVTNLNVGGAIAVTNADLTRTNLGIPLPALTNTSNTNFQAAIFTTNSIPTNSANVNAINFNTAVAWVGITVVTNGVTNTFRIPLFQ